MKTQSIKQRVSELKEYLDHYEVIEKLEQLIIKPLAEERESSGHLPEGGTTTDDTSDPEKFHNDK